MTIDTVYDADTYSGMWTLALKAADAGRDRSVQASSGQIGVSDIGGCREKTRRRLMGEAPSSSTDNIAAICGTMIHEGALAARREVFPHLLIEQTVTVTLPNGCVVPGHADEIDPQEPSVTDLKTVNGLEFVRRHGATEQQIWQRNLYLLGAAQAGIVEKQGLTRNVWMDRSGSTSEVHVEQTPFDQGEVDAATRWLDDVIYAATNDEQASKDKPLPWCLSYCEFAASCRAGDLDAPLERITDREVINAARTLLEAREQQKHWKKLEEQSKQRTEGVNGLAQDVILRQVTVNGANGPYTKQEVRRA
jgi:hypothetical protein